MWTVLWVLWGCGFIVIEGAALLKDKWAGTLSDHLRLWFRTDTKIGRTVWLAVSGCFFAWFIVHIAIVNSV